MTKGAARPVAPHLTAVVKVVLHKPMTDAERAEFANFVKLQAALFLYTRASVVLLEVETKQGYQPVEIVPPRS